MAERLRGIGVLPALAVVIAAVAAIVGTVWLIERDAGPDAAREDAELSECLVAAFRDKEVADGAAGAQCFGIDEQVFADNPLLVACTAAAANRDPVSRVARRAERCLRAFDRPDGAR